ncbi:lanthionine synthetase LanC family protein [Mucilaginibacter sp. P25]|uniref:lanthionine synthetase LanC family protein n=1 Tax=Mucilaginibacter sp. P25 TaxID=3423945 RepID=UPI003D7957D5
MINHRYQSYNCQDRTNTDSRRLTLGFTYKQYDIHRKFESKGILPKPIAYFELNGDAFFSMEYKECVSLTEKAAELSEGHTWRFVLVERKRAMIAYLLQIVKILGIFHEEKIVHRDVTATNFIVTRTGQVFAIDIELSYDLGSPARTAAFTLGTPGYMSPAQTACSEPAFADDIYSLGALLISVLTGLLPNRLNHVEMELLEKSLSWFIESRSLVSLITLCLSEDPASRPSLSEIRHVLELYDTVLTTTSHKTPDYPLNMQLKSVEAILTEGFRTVYLLLAKAGKAEIVTLLLFNKYFPDEEQKLFIVHTDALPNGSAKIELSERDLQILAVELSKQTDSTVLLLNFMSKAVPTDDGSIISLSVCNGFSGKGLSLFYLMGQTLFETNPFDLAEIVNRIVAYQERDGSWVTTRSADNNRGDKVTGFSHGVSGIVYFLLSYYGRYGTQDLKERIVAALDWLTQQRKQENGRLTWTVSVGNKIVDPWLEHGFSGVALTYIKAFEVLGDEGYKRIASEVLSYHPLYITSNNCAFGNGLAGLGEIYLEAFRVFGDRAWLDRANAIQGALLNSCYRAKGQCYWLDGTQLNPTADFWSGNMGILHFLLRVTRPNEVSFPIHLIA